MNTPTAAPAAVSQATPTQRTGAPAVSGLKAGAADAGLLIARVAAGGILMAHGAQKIFEFTLAGTTASFEQMGVPAAALAAPFIAYLELIGGALLILGLATRVIGALLALDMLGALFLVHLSAGVFVGNGGYELVAALGALALALALIGPGRVSVDALISKARSAQRG